MDNFMISFDANKRAQEIMNASKSLFLRSEELRRRVPKSIQEAMAINEEMIQIAKDMMNYEEEMRELAKAKINSMIGNIERMENY